VKRNGLKEEEGRRRREGGGGKEEEGRRREGVGVVATLRFVHDSE
jgi:hypothetical protein